MVWNVARTPVEDRIFRHRIFERYPESFAVNLAERYLSTFKGKGRREANLELLRTSKRIPRGSLLLSSSDDEICSVAKLKADDCFRFFLLHSDEFSQYDALRTYVEHNGIEAPAPKCEFT